MEVLLGILLAVGVVLGFMVWLTRKATRTRDQNEELARQYRKKMREVHRLKEQTHRYTMPRWPIWPRPILYEKIDMDTQVAFAQVVQSIAVAQSESCHVQSIPDEPFSVASLHKHLYVFLRYNENNERWKLLQQTVHSIEGLLQNINENLQNVLAAQASVEQAVIGLKKDVSENMQKLPDIQKMRGQHDFEIIKKQVENAAYFMTEAEKSLLHRNSEDGIEYARAHLCCRGSKVMLDSFQAGFVQFSYPANVELDETFKLTQSLNTFVLNDIPAISNQGWKSLIKVNEFLLKAESILKQIRKSLKEFETEYHDFRERVKSLESIKYEEQINQAIDAETALSEYWGTIDKNPGTWREVLGETQRPSEGLVELQNQLQREIGPMLRPENIIKQSHMDYILAKLDEAINAYKHLELIVRKIQKHVREQKDAQEQVFKKIGEGGEARIALNQLAAVRDDTTKDINREINSAIESFNQLCSRADHPLGANYPTLLTDLGRFASECKRIKTKHDQEIALRETEANAFVRQIRTLFDKITALGQRTPRVDMSFDTIKAKFNETNGQRQAAGSSYNALVAFIKRAASVVSDFEQTIQKIEKQFRDYEDSKLEIGRAVKAKQEEIANFMVRIGMDWSKPLHNHLRTLSTFSQNLGALLVQLQDADRMSSLSKAVRHCEEVRNELRSYANSIAVEMKKIEDELNTLVQKDRHLQEMFSHAFDLKLRDIPGARNVRERAKDQDDFRYACLFLDRALEILETGGDTININDVRDSQVNVAKESIHDVHYVSHSYNSGENKS
jgi:hypothetical protein